MREEPPKRIEGAKGLCGARRLALASLLLLVAASTACSKTPKEDPHYRPPENILEIVAVLQHHVSDDTYRYPPARDYTGRNVYRASLLRLENLERVHADALRAGYMDEVLAFAKARALERLRAFALAAESYRGAADKGGELRAEALWGAAVCSQLERAMQLTLFQQVPYSAAEFETLITGAELVLTRYGARIALLENVLAENLGTHYEAVVLEEIERADWDRVRYFLATRQLLEDGDERALAELKRSNARHIESKNANGQIIEAATLYASMAREYVRSHPPEGLYFDPVRFRELVDATTRLYEKVSHQDGIPERLEAARELEAFLAFTLRVDIDRFTQ